MPQDDSGAQVPTFPKWIFPTQKHWKQLHKWGIPEWIIKTNKFWTVHEERVARQICGRNGGPALAPALVVPNFGLDGCATHAYLEPEGSSALLSISPKGMSPRLGFPLHIPREDYLDVTKPLVLIEGIKEACALSAAMGLPTIAAFGMWGWHDIRHRDGFKVERALAKKKRMHVEIPGEWRLHPDFADVPLKGRLVYAISSEEAFAEREHGAENRLIHMLLAVGARTRIVRGRHRREYPFPSSREQVVDQQIERFNTLLGDMFAAQSLAGENADAPLQVHEFYTMRDLPQKRRRKV